MWQFHFNYEDLTVLDLKDTGNEKTSDGCFLIRRNYFDKNQFSTKQKYSLHTFIGSGDSTGIFRLAQKLMNGR